MSKDPEATAILTLAYKAPEPEMSQMWEPELSETACTDSVIFAKFTLSEEICRIKLMLGETPFA